ncbi:altered inheritance of mitochondria protein 3-like isoform X2 [Cimex lectularius]|uniref:Uncharacterized protein n=1 Tax=Cimex lectularius TaxID=79782 RepID=A0A8I6S8A5_CIMLE|nr:altered inheritance of mitochondria protein 3-like isoform X2 [Cimex lectularius]
MDPYYKMWQQGPPPSPPPVQQLPMLPAQYPFPQVNFHGNPNGDELKYPKKEFYPPYQEPNRMNYSLVPYALQPPPPYGRPLPPTPPPPHQMMPLLPPQPQLMPPLTPPAQMLPPLLPPIPLPYIMNQPYQYNWNLRYKWYPPPMVNWQVRPFVYQPPLQQHYSIASNIQEPPPRRKPFGLPSTGTWTRLSSENFEFKPSLYPDPSVNFGVFGQSQLVSLGLRNLTKKDVSFPPAKCEETTSFKNEEIDKNVFPDALPSLMQMLSRGPLSSLSNIKIETPRGTECWRPLNQIHSKSRIKSEQRRDVFREGNREMQENDLQIGPEKDDSQSMYPLSGDSQFKLPSKKLIGIESEYVLKVENYESSSCPSQPEKMEDEVMKMVSAASSLIVPHPSSNPYMNSPLPDEEGQYQLKSKSSKLEEHSTSSSTSQTSENITPESFAQGDREKPKVKLHAKHIEEVTVNILTMFAHHEGQDDSGSGKWNPERIVDLGTDTETNIKFLMHLLTSDIQELGRSLTRRQKRDLAGMIEVQLGRFKLTGSSWASVCEDIVNGLNNRIVLLEKLMPHFAHSKEVEYS